MRRALWVPLCILGLAVAHGTARIRAATKTWIDGSSTWSTAGNWSLAGAPLLNDTVIIAPADGSARTVTYNVNAPSLTALYIDLTGAGTAAMTLSIPAANNLTVGGIIVGGHSGIAGTNGRGALIQSAGTVSTGASLDMILAYGAGSSGAYTLNGGALVVNQSEFVGFAGAGTFTHTGGSNTINASAVGLFSVGHVIGSTGTYNLSGAGVLIANESEYVGYSGTGTFAQTGGTNIINGSSRLILGFAGGTGTYTLSAGDLQVGSEEDIGYNGTGIFTQSGGTNTTGSLYISANNTSAQGTYTLSGGALVCNATEFVGYVGTGGVFNHSGGTNTIGSNLQLGYLGGSAGVYNLSGSGALVVNASEYIGSEGAGTFYQSGGTNAISGSNRLFVGYAGGTGVYTLSAGDLQVAGEEDIGYASAGVFNQSGGKNSMGSLYLGNNANVQGTYTLSGGVISCAVSELVGYGGVGVFNQSGGSNAIALNLIVGTLSGGSGAYTLTGGNANVGQDVMVGGNAMSNSTGVLNVGGNGVLTVGGALIAKNTLGTIINFTGGTIHASALNFNGVPALFNWTAGTLDLTANVTFDSAAASTSTSSAFGQSLSLAANQTLKVTGNETLGGAGTFALTLNSGSAHDVTGNLAVQPTGSITINPGSALTYSTLTQAGGVVTGALRNQGAYVYQGGQFNGQLLNQGTASFSANGFVAASGVQNEGIMTVAQGVTITVNGSGINNVGSFTTSGGGSALSGAGPVVNAFGGTMQARGTINSVLTNNGLFTVTGVLALTNASAATNNGILQGNGTIAGNFINAAGGTVNVAPGNPLAITSAWSSAGLVEIQGPGALLNGGAITNTGTIQGAGAVNSPIANTGALRASGGELVLGGAGITNAAAGVIQAATGSTVLVLQGLTSNAGTIALTGGAFDNNNRPLANPGVINGYGTLRTGGLNSTGKLNVGEGNMDVFGPVVNNGTVGVQGGRSIYFFSPYSGAGSFTGPGSATFLAAVSPGNSPAAVSFDGNVDLASSATLIMELGGATPGSLYDQLLIAGQLSLGGALQVSLINGFNPLVNQTFNLWDSGATRGSFLSIGLPALVDKTWDTSQLYSEGLLKVVSAYLAADFDHNGTVNAADLANWRAGFGAASGALHTQGDANNDGAVNGADFAIWQQQLGSSSPTASAAATVPETHRRPPHTDRPRRLHPKKRQPI